MSSLQVSTVLAGLAVSDMNAAVDWYRILLGREPDARPMAASAGWTFPGNYTLQVVHDPERAGGSMVTLHVADVATARDDLAGRGIEMTVDDSTPEAVRIGQVTDPDGNSVTLVEPTSGSDSPDAAQDAR